MQERPETSTKRRKSASAETPSVKRPTTVGKTKGTNNSKQEPSGSLALWAKENDIPAADLAQAYGARVTPAAVEHRKTEQINAGLSEHVEVGRYIAMDCEMVGVGGAAPNNANNDEYSVLARVSIVNYHGDQIYDSFVRPKEYVTNWRTAVSGVTPGHMATARDLETVQNDVAALLKGRVLVGHSIHNDLKVLFLDHPRYNQRDTSQHPIYQRQSPALKKLAKEILGLDIQGGEHSSVEDARVCMLLYRQHKNAFEAEHARRWSHLQPKAVTKVESHKKDIKSKTKEGKNKKKSKK
ncbi:MAG: hypothetical protein M1823_005088 [Watsoniomyces obsoletus]|nr:MAG: hypothetical protein M1823_005088 [Watsoniomyces obsoletus]